MAVEIEFLKSIPYFSGLGAAELEAIKRRVFEKTVDRNEFILLEEEPAEAVYFVVSGAVKAFKTSAEGKEQILCILRPGESYARLLQPWQAKRTTSPYGTLSTTWIIASVCSTTGWDPWRNV